MNYSEELRSIQEAYASIYETDSYLEESMASSSRMKEIMGNERPPRSREFEKRLPTPRSREFEKRLPSPSASSSVKRGGQVQHMGRDLKNSADLFDIVMGHLIDEGYADTEDAALAIMANMSEEWRDSIIEEVDSQGNRSHDLFTDKPNPNYKPGNRKPKPKPTVKKQPPMRDEPLW